MSLLVRIVIALLCVCASSMALAAPRGAVAAVPARTAVAPQRSTWLATSPAQVHTARPARRARAHGGFPGLSTLHRAARDARRIARRAASAVRAPFRSHRPAHPRGP